MRNLVDTFREWLDERFYGSLQGFLLEAFVFLYGAVSLGLVLWMVLDAVL